MWEPITLAKLNIKISQANLSIDLSNLWNSIKIEPKKWEEKEYGDLGGGFWVVAIIGQRIIWYNDIEEGFNICTFQYYGQIDSYGCEQYELNHILYALNTDNQKSSDYCS